MRISWNWLSEMVDLSQVKTPAALAEILTLRGLEVEAIERQDRGFEKVVTALILERAPHPQADRLSLCKVSTGGAEPLEIVCGAQNMKEGDKVALAQIGAELPNGLKISQSKIRGVTSHGMLCSEKELGLKDSSGGILILPADTGVGEPLAKVLGRDDAVLVFKLTANRGDCLSHWGMAREVAAALGQRARSPSFPLLSAGGISPISVSLDAGSAAPQFWGVYIENVEVRPSPAWVVKRLETLGSRSINNVVDATNLVMLEFGHPMHAYDAEKIRGGRVHVRFAETGEQLPLLDGQTVSLGGTELVISDSERAVGLAGVMGGGNSEVQDSTKSLFLECAEFDPVLVRRASTLHQKRTEAAHRFEKGVDPQGLQRSVSRLAQLIHELAGGVVKGVVAERLERAGPVPEIEVDFDFFERFLGMPVGESQAEGILRGLDCQVRKNGRKWMVLPPSHRFDLRAREDLAEELARSIGYDQISETIPCLTSFPQSSQGHSAASRLSLGDRVKDLMVDYGLLEAVSYPWISAAKLRQFGLSSTAKVLNPMSEEGEFLVPSLLPHLIDHALNDWRHHFGSEAVGIGLFELRPTFFAPTSITALSEMETGVEERWKVGFLISGPRYAQSLRNEQGEVDFFDLKALVENLLESLGTKGVRFLALQGGKTPIGSLFHPGQAVDVWIGKDIAGSFGLLHPALSRELKTRTPVWMGELDFEMIQKLSRPVFESVLYRPWPEFPGMERDFALLVRSDVTADRISQLALKAAHPLAKKVKIFDVYKGGQVAEGMTSIGVRVIFYDETRSLTEVEAEGASQKILEVWRKELQAELRS